MQDNSLHTLTSTMPWLQDAAETLVQALDQNRMAHAVLISGDQGVGKRWLAEALAALMVCERRVPGSRAPCGECRQCRLVAGESHPDIRICQPEKSKMIRIDQIRALSEFAVASPQVAVLKVVILDRADQLNLNAANALLKTLEEPAGDVVLLLLQETGRPVLPTIRSRCRVLPVPTPGPEQAAHWLLSQPLEVGASETAGDTPQRYADPEAAALALAMAGNSPRLALTWLASDFMERREVAAEAFRQFLKGAVALPEATRAFKGLGQDVVLTLFETWAADLARAAVGGEGRDPSMAGVVGYLAGANPPWQAHLLVEQIRESRQAMVNNAGADLEISRLLLAWRALMPARRRAPVADSPA